MSPLIIPVPVFRAISGLIWRLPGTPARKMAEFSHVEAGSGLDMLEATEFEKDPVLRKKYYLHALDELRHAALFRERARILAKGKHSRAHAVLEDTGYIAEHGIRSELSMIERLSEVQFLAFIYLHERAGAEQFAFYGELLRDDPSSHAMFDQIAKDERFHISYTKTELDRLKAAGKPVGSALFMTHMKDLWEGWIRGSARFGDWMSGLWLGLLYYIVITPFALLSREKLKGGLQMVPPPPSGEAYGRQLA